MKKTFFLIPLFLLGAATSVMAEPSAVAVASWHAQTLVAAIGNVLLFAALGIMADIIVYKAFDKYTPGELHKEIIEHRNIAAAIVAAAVIIGVSIIIAASIMG